MRLPLGKRSNCFQDFGAPERILVAFLAIFDFGKISLGDFELRGAAMETAEFVSHGQIVGGNVGHRGVGVENGVHQAVWRIDGNNVALYIQRTIGSATPQKRRAGLPVAFGVAAEHVLANEFGIGENFPKKFGGSGDFDRLMNQQFGHGDYPLEKV